MTQEQQAKLCPKCGTQLEKIQRKMSELDHCGRCDLVLLDAVELDFVLGRDDVEENFLGMARPVTLCRHCGNPLGNGEHCQERQALPCALCKATMQLARIDLRAYYQQDLEQFQRAEDIDPYRGMVARQEEAGIFYVYVCPSCKALALADALLVLMIEAFSNTVKTTPKKPRRFIVTTPIPPKKNAPKPVERPKTAADNFRVGLLRLFAQNRKSEA